MKNKIKLVVLVFVAIFTIKSSVVSARWSVESVDAPKSFSLCSRSLAVDTDGHPHITYGGDHLYYAFNDGTGWKYEAVDLASGVGYHASIALDSSGNAHISYYDLTNQNLKYATNASGLWVTETIDSSGAVGRYTSIAIDLSGNVHISYFYLGDQDGLKYATNSSGSWVTEVIDSVMDTVFKLGGKGTSIALDISGGVHISYYDETNQALKHATNASGLWVIETVDSGNYGYSTIDLNPSIAIDSSDNVHISYFDDIYFHQVVLKYATNVSGSWVAETIDSVGLVGAGTSIALDASGKAHISYYDETSQALKYVNNSSGSWVTATVDSGIMSGLNTTIALDSSSKVHIRYHGFGNHDLKYATNASGAWVTEKIDSSGSVGDGTSIALDSSGNAHISHIDRVTNNPKYVTKVSGSWITETIDSEAWVGWVTHIALDSSDKAHIIYHDDASFSLKYATNASGSWVIETVDSGNYVYSVIETGYSFDIDSSIAIDSSDIVHISYFDYTNQVLKYATNASGSWQTQTVDIGKNQSMSIAIDSSDKVHIIYHDFTNDSIKYATNVSSSWRTETVDIGNFYSSTPSITLDSSDKAHVFYFHHDDVTNSSAIRYSTKVSGSWVAETVLSGGDLDVATNISIAIDSSVKVHISYFDYTNGTLKYTTNSSGSWVTETVDSETMPRRFGPLSLHSRHTSIAIDSSCKVHISYPDSINFHLKYAKTLTPCEKIIAPAFMAIEKYSFDGDEAVVLMNNSPEPVTIDPRQIIFSNGVGFYLLSILSNIQGFVDLSTPASIAPNGAEVWLVLYIYIPLEVGYLTDTLIIPSSDFGGVDIEIPVNGFSISETDLTVTVPGVNGSNKLVDFGDVALNTSESSNRTILLTNNGSSSLTIAVGAISLSGGSRFAITSITSSLTGEIDINGPPVSIAARGTETWTIDINLNNTVYGIVSDTLNIATWRDGSYQWAESIMLRGNVKTAQNIVVSDIQGTHDDHQINFDSVNTDGPGGMIATSRVSISNTGEMPITIPASGISLPGGTSFQIVEVKSNLRGIIDISSSNRIAGNSKEIWEVDLVFDPSLPGSLSDSLVISSNDPEDSSLVVNLTGTGFGGPDIEINIPGSKSGTSIDFLPTLADGSAGQAGKKEMVIRNIGGESLVVNTILLNGDSRFIVDSIISSTKELSKNNFHKY